MSSIEQTSFWLATRREYTPSPAFAGEHEIAIAIIGNGFTGLWTSIFLKELTPEASIIVLEQAILGYGGSGRNAGQVSGCIDHSHHHAIAHFGEEEARRMARVGLGNLNALAQFIKERGLACEFERPGQLLVALTPAQAEEARSQIDAAEELGVARLRLLSGEETRAELTSPLYLGGVVDPGWGIVHPIKLVDGLKREAVRLGAKQSP